MICCRIELIVDTFVSEFPQIVPFCFGAVDQGQVVHIACVVATGNEPTSIQWSLQGKIVSSDPAISTTMLGTRTSLLTIASVNYQHIGTYTCTATNAAGSTSYSAELKGNGKTSQYMNILI